MEIYEVHTVNSSFFLLIWQIVKSTEIGFLVKLFSSYYYSPLVPFSICLAIAVFLSRLTFLRCSNSLILFINYVYFAYFATLVMFYGIQFISSRYFFPKISQLHKKKDIKGNKFIMENK